MRILILSLKKPVDEPRMTKIALSVSGHRVERIGGEHRWGAWGRFWQAYRRIGEFSPDWVIIQHPILLPLAWVWRRSWFAYDVQENYALNLLHNPAYRYPTKYLKATMIRLIERMTIHRISVFFLAEQVYALQLRFPRSVVVENRCWPEGLPERRPAAYPVLLVCGTISRLFGADRAVRFFERLQKHFPEVILEVVGHGVEADLVDWLHQKAVANPAIKLQISPKPMEHPILLRSMARAWFLLLPHPRNPCTAGKFPTKLYEALAIGVPVLAQAGHDFAQLVETHQAGLVIDFEDSNTETIARQMKNHNLWVKTALNPFWEKEVVLRCLLQYEAQVGRIG